MSKSLAIAYQMKRKGKKKAEGGEVEVSPNDGPVSEDEAKKFAQGAGFAEGGAVSPMQEVTCPHCTKTFSHGGEVANDVGEGAESDEKPNEFDYLELTGGLDSHGGNSGDEIGGPDKDDAVSRAMIKRKKAKSD